ncbi:TetR/AcrR family transcriptional regulator [Klenkia brasiliensis]|uniref:Transcriptional regulator, TetR family n=1 Tax=Klenkia brasiliensis TaxID=333142 RepID=A0A1G7VCE7_9ACTN|nr:TetR/AcrR family transcriptional regulator [Klenkia brasiliensis]SDG57424.1 transcriptional regulator, TetR family [Klenkia brasiliensis]
MTPRPGARQRLLDAAEELFASGGFAGTPVDAVLARAGVAPATLYAHFGSKTGLQAAALAARLRRWDDVWSAAVAAAPDDRARLLAVFDALDAFGTGGTPSRWCAFLDAAAGAPADDGTAVAALAEDTALLRGRLRELAAPVAGEDAAELAEHLLVVVTGALAMALRTDPARATAQGRATAAALVDRWR